MTQETSAAVAAEPNAIPPARADFPLSAIAQTIGNLFGEYHASRWLDCLAAAVTRDGERSAADIGAAFVVWLAYVDEVEEALSNLRSVRLLGVEAETTLGLTIIPPPSLSEWPGLNFISTDAAEAVARALIEPTAAEAVQTLSVWEDTDGRAGIEIFYALSDAKVSSHYGDRPAAASLRTVRTLSGETLRAVNRNLCALIEPPDPRSNVGSGALELEGAH